MEGVDENAIYAAEEVTRQLFLAAVSFLVASASGVVVPLRDGKFRDGWHLACLGLVTGFVGLCCSCGFLFFVGRGPGALMAVIFVSSAVGLSGKKVDGLPMAILEAVLQKAGIDIVDDESSEEPSDANADPKEVIDVSEEVGP